MRFQFHLSRIASDRKTVFEIPDEEREGLSEKARTELVDDNFRKLDGEPHQRRL